MIIPPKYVNGKTGRVEGRNVLCVGQTGSGKTYLSNLALEERRFVVIHDAKGTFHENFCDGDLRKDGGRYDVAKTLNAAVASRADRICYSPDRNELFDDVTQDAFWEWIWRRGNCTVLVDEGKFVVRGQDLPPAMLHCYVGGRERGIEIIFCTQEPVYVPNVVFTQSRFFLVFFLNLRAHQDKVCGFVPLQREQIAQLRPRLFYMYGDTWRAASGPYTWDDDAQKVTSVSLTPGAEVA